MADSRRVLAFYKFHPMPDLAALQARLEGICAQQGIKGTILLAEEGLNGTVVGTTPGLQILCKALTGVVEEIAFKWSDLNEANPGFHRLKVKIKPEIVSFGVPGLDITNTGTHVDVDRWNELISDPDVIVIDTRNTYEIDIGTFPGAVSPETTNFRQFPDWVEQNLDPDEHPKVAMFCTGGIRCEKASAYMLAQGFDEVYQLDGGILKYLEDSAPEANRWEGECFVFDQRVSVDKQLTQGGYKQCFACRHPLSKEDQASPEYEEGVCCGYCSGRNDEDRVARFRQRNKQIKLAASRGEQHIGKTQKPPEAS
ncbi:MAG: rhodanese-related sulfurtransferase [Pseudomonadota bacterium]